MSLALTAQQTHSLRLRSQRLLFINERPPTSPSQVLEGIAGVQAQDLPAAQLSLRVRSAGLTAAMVDQALQEERSIVWTWCMRGTLHLVAAEDAGWLVSLLGSIFIAAGRCRLENLGWDEARPARGLRLLLDALAERGGLTRSEIAGLLKENGLPNEGQAPLHLLYRASLEGNLCLGPNRGKKPTYVLSEVWIGKPPPLSRPQALERIAARYLDAYCPAGPADLAGWSGLKLTEARQAFQLITDQLVQVESVVQPAWMLKSHLPRLDEPLGSAPVVWLLPRFDTFLLGYANRDLVLDPACAKFGHPGGGIIHPVLLVDGKAIGTWETKRRKAILEIRLRPFIMLPGKLLPLIEAEVAELARLLGEEAVLTRENPSRA